MFSLIITIISIALVAALAVATIYYGGDAFNQGSSKAKASSIVNQAQQIAGANTLYKSNTGGYASTLASLQTASYLASQPANSDIGTWAVNGANNEVTATLVAGKLEVCQKINDIANGSTDGVYNPNSQFGCDTANLGFKFKG